MKAKIALTFLLFSSLRVVKLLNKGATSIGYDILKTNTIQLKYIYKWKQVTNIDLNNSTQK